MHCAFSLVLVGDDKIEEIRSGAGNRLLTPVPKPREIAARPKPLQRRPGVSCLGFHRSASTGRGVRRRHESRRRRPRDMPASALPVIDAVRALLGLRAPASHLPDRETWSFGTEQSRPWRVVACSSSGGRCRRELTGRGGRARTRLGRRQPGPGCHRRQKEKSGRTRMGPGLEDHGDSHGAAPCH